MSKLKAIERIFRFNGQDLPDPNPSWDAERVRRSYAETYPQITNATIKGPTVEGDKAVYKIETVVGTKG